MNELERKLVFNQSLKKEIKIFRNQSIACIEDLSNEIIYEIFDYFDGGELVKTFSDLNYRFEQLLHSSLILIKTHFYLFHYQEIMNTFNEFDILSNKICSNLKILSIICSKNIIFLDASQWERLILQYYPQLEKFYFIYHERLDNNNQYQLYSRQTNSFSSSFWIERKWIFDVKINNTEIKYVVYPYSKRWYDNIDNYSVEPFTFTNLTVECILDMTFDVVQKQIEQVLRITEIYHLEILEKHFRMSLLIQVVNLLSNITTLKLHSLPTIETITITFDEFSLLLSMKEASKITKVYLEEIGDIQELDFIFMLCPYIEYFKVGRLNMIDIKTFLRIIFNKMNHYQIYYLRSLCFHVQTSDDRVVENIEEMIKYEKIFHHFTIKRILDTVYLQWK